MVIIGYYSYHMRKIISCNEELRKNKIALFLIENSKLTFHFSHLLILKFIYFNVSSQSVRTVLISANIVIAIGTPFSNLLSLYWTESVQIMLLPIHVSKFNGKECKM